ncbi:MAG: DNRLRE domain-containing protein, partial [Thermoplasmata archaeon]
DMALSPIDDTYIDESNPSDVFGAGLELNVDGGNQEMAFLKFDLCSVSAPVEVAMLKLYITNGADGKQYVHEVSDNSWTESTLTWNNAPDLGKEIGMTTGGEKEGILYVEVTDYINEKIGGLASLAFQSEDTDQLIFSSAEASSYPAQLDLFTRSQPTDITSTITLVHAGDEWRYSETDPQPATNPNWNEPGYGDSGWLSGSAPFGYGDSTTYGTELNDNDGSYYFRKTFNLDSGTKIQSAKLNVSSDNYAQVYLNGVIIDDDSGANHEFEYWNRAIDVPSDKFQTGTNTVAVFVYNSAGSSDAYMDLDLKIKIQTDANINQPPTITSTDIKNAVEGQLYTKTYAASDPENDVLTWSLQTDASWLLMDHVTGVLSGTPPSGSSGSYLVKVMVSDTTGSDSNEFTLIVTKTPVYPQTDNNAPAITNKAFIPTTVDANSNLVFMFTAQDPDSDALNWSKIAGPEWLIIASDSGTIYGTPSSKDIGSNEFKIKVSDGKGGEEIHTFTITVTDPSDKGDGDQDKVSDNGFLGNVYSNPGFILIILILIIMVIIVAVAHIQKRKKELEKKKVRKTKKPQRTIKKVKK